MHNAKASVPSLPEQQAQVLPKGKNTGIQREDCLFVLKISLISFQYG
jgi:hypothetical protein